MEKRLWMGWRYDREDWGLLINADEIEHAIETWDSAWLISGIDPARVDELNELLDEYRAENGPLRGWEVEEFFGSVDGAEVSPADAYITPQEDVLIFWAESQIVEHLPDCPTTPIYRWWDGHNWKVERLDECQVEYRIMLGGCVDLDEWDGRNRQTGGMGHHAQVHRVVELDGETPETPTYLLEEWSQWQGDHAVGKLVTEDELPGILEEYGRDPQEYLPKIKALENE